MILTSVNNAIRQELAESSRRLQKMPRRSNPWMRISYNVGLHRDAVLVAKDHELLSKFLERKPENAQ